jgi:hypothetical protein
MPNLLDCILMVVPDTINSRITILCSALTAVYREEKYFPLIVLGSAALFKNNIISGMSPLNDAIYRADP